MPATRCELGRLAACRSACARADGAATVVADVRSRRTADPIDHYLPRFQSGEGDRHEHTKGKTLFITGASRGIGLAIARRAARDAPHRHRRQSVVANPKLPARSIPPPPRSKRRVGRPCRTGGHSRRGECCSCCVSGKAFWRHRYPRQQCQCDWLRGTADTPMKRYDLMHQVNARGTFLVRRLACPI